MSRRRRGIQVHVITTPEDQTVVPVETINDFKHSVAVNATYTPEKNAVYRNFKAKMASVKAR